MSALPMGIPAPPAGYIVSNVSRFIGWAKLTDVPVPDWSSYFKAASHQRLNAIGVEERTLQTAEAITMQDLARNEEYQPSYLCMYTVTRRRVDKRTHWYIIRRIDTAQRAYFSATIKHTSESNWERCGPFRNMKDRSFTLQCSGDYSPKDVLEEAVSKGFKL